MPIQAVVLVDGAPTVFVQNDQRIETRRLEPGISNNRMLPVYSGLEAGEWILMNPPLESGALPSVIQPSTAAEKSGDPSNTDPVFRDANNRSSRAYGINRQS